MFKLLRKLFKRYYRCPYNGCKHCKEYHYCDLNGKCNFEKR